MKVVIDIEVTSVDGRWIDVNKLATQLSNIYNAKFKVTNVDYARNSFEGAQVIRMKFKANDSIEI